MKNLFCSLISMLVLFSAWSQQRSADSFVSVKGHQFYLQKRPYYFSGANYWYGSFLSLLQDRKKGIERLRRELDFLQSNGVNNLRILAAVEGGGPINGVQRVQPAFQTAAGIFNQKVLEGLDVLLFEMGKRKMKAVLFLSNNWEWSGGFLQYLQWEHLIEDSVFRRKLSWDEQRDYTSRFYSCTACMENYQKQLQQILGRTNTITHQTYINDPAIMAWEIANEPRPMRPAANTAYARWIKTTTALIKQLDKNHLVTLGHEGTMATDGDQKLYQQIHAIPGVDYLTIHIWPKNWGWIINEDLPGSINGILNKTNRYIDEHVQIAAQLGKPLVIEEFGLPRDSMLFSAGSTTVNRDIYYSAIIAHWRKSLAEKGVIAGFNFWAFGGIARPIEEQVFWKAGDDYMGDPPMEEQGLNSVFDSDISSWDIITATPSVPPVQ
ncbi:MAG: cellulase family glycosylhydrolase [Chitinophagaceae bacterium]|nr:cellulase family glycosylhydrolase [Chitinophagaceae bacterium]